MNQGHWNWKGERKNVEVEENDSIDCKIFHCLNFLNWLQPSTCVAWLAVFVQRMRVLSHPLQLILCIFSFLATVATTVVSSAKIGHRFHGGGVLWFPLHNGLVECCRFAEHWFHGGDFTCVPISDSVCVLFNPFESFSCKWFLSKRHTSNKMRWMCIGRIVCRCQNSMPCLWHWYVWKQ